MPDFDITIPDVGELVTAPQGTILVRVLNASLDTGFMAVMNDMAGSTIGMGPLAQEGTTDFYSAQLPAGNLPTSAPAPGFNNRTVMVEGLLGSSAQGNPVTHAFRAWTGSGFSGAADVAAQAGPQGQGDAPLPALLLVQPDPSAEDSAQSAQPSVTLAHAQDPAFEGCWFSAPIDLRPGPAAGFWMLRRCGATWKLLLWCDGVLVMYQQPADAAAHRLPLTLARAGAATSTWPRAVTVVPAP